jgi:hypothetical protein
VSAEKKEFQAVIRQHAEEKRKLEEKLSEQKQRIAMLIKEFR